MSSLIISVNSRLLQPAGDSALVQLNLVKTKVTEIETDFGSVSITKKITPDALAKPTKIFQYHPGQKMMSKLG